MAKKVLGVKKNTLAKIRKKHGGGSAADVSIETAKIPWLPCSSPAINKALGGGIPFGRILELYGAFSSGKTLLAYDFLYNAQQLGGQGLWVDAENAWTENWADKNYIDTDKVELLTDISIENISDWLVEVGMYYRSILVNNEPIVAIIDSTAALDTDDNLNTSQLDSKAEMGNRAKAIYKMIRLRNPLFVKLGITVIFINQMRDKVGASKYEDPNTTVGGRAMEFFASQRMALIGGKAVRSNGKKGLIVGKEVSVRMHKNKVAPPISTFKTEMYFTDAKGNSIGMNPNLGLYDMLIDDGSITKKGGSTKVYLGDSDESLFIGGEKGLIKLLESDDGDSFLDKMNINNTEKTQSLLDSLEDNLYPVGDKSEYVEGEEEEEEGDE